MTAIAFASQSLFEHLSKILKVRKYEGEADCVRLGNEEDDVEQELLMGSHVRCSCLRMSMNSKMLMSLSASLALFDQDSRTLKTKKLIMILKVL